MDIPENILVVYLAGGGFFPARVVPDLDIGDLLQGLPQIRYQVPF